MLKTKAFIYRNTGIYLAHKEENEYVDSMAYWREFSRLLADPENFMTPRTIHGVLIGLWQARHGFVNSGKERFD